MDGALGTLWAAQRAFDFKGARQYLREMSEYLRKRASLSLTKCLSTLVVLGALIVVPCASSGAAAKPAAKEPLCSAIVSVGAIRGATAMPGTALEPTSVAGPNPYHWSKSNDTFWDFWVSRLVGKANLPGSICVYDDPQPGTSYTQTVADSDTVGDDFVAVGYGESEANWRTYKTQMAINGGDAGESLDIPISGIHGNAPESPLSLGSGSQAILNSVNLVAAQDADPTDYPNFPASYYIVTVFTQRHNMLQIGMYGASLAATEAVVKSALSNRRL